MGLRGRHKAKQTKVARELKYHTSSIDVTALQRELASGTTFPSTSVASAAPGDEVEDDEYDSDLYADPYATDDDEDDDGRSSYASAR